MAGWRLREAAGEAWRSVGAGLWRTITLGVVTAWLVGALVWVEFGTTDDVLGFQRGFERRGGWVGVATDPQGRIDAARCAALAHRSGVVHAGALGVADTMQTTAAPGTLFQTAAATAGAIRLWAADPPTHGDLVSGLVLGQAAARELGLRPGMHLSVAGDDRIRSIGAIVDTEARNPFIARWILDVAAPAGTASQCWVEYSPQNLDIGLQVLEATFADLRPDLEVRRWIRLDEFARDPITELAARPQAQAWIPAGIVITLLVWLTVWVRTAEIGLYRAVGTPTATLWLLGQLETLYVLIPATLTGYLWAAATHAALTDLQPGVDQLLIAARTTASALLLALTLAPLAWLLAGRRSIAAQLKDR